MHKPRHRTLERVTKRRALLSLGLVVAVAVAWWVAGTRTGPTLIATNTVATASPTKLPEPYAALADAVTNGDTLALDRIAFEDDSYRAYSAAMALATNEELSAGTRLLALHRALELRLVDPLQREANLELLLLRGDLAREAGEHDEAIAAFREALPDGRATSMFELLEADPYRRSAAFQNAGMQTRALEELGDLAAPSIEAPALRALGRHEEALDAYHRWLAEVPDSETARSGVAWSLYYLGRNEEAAVAFRALGADGEYGLGLLANRAGDVAGAVSHFVRTGRADLLWLATDLLEARDMYSEALPIYMRLARGSSAWADDAAYRAVVLGSRLGDAAVVEEARNLLPPGSFFAYKLGVPAQVPVSPTVAGGAAALTSGGGVPGDPVTDVAALANELTMAGAQGAAVGELLFALRQAEATSDVADIVTLAGLLQESGEYRQSMRAARALLPTARDDVRVWRLAYPRAWEPLVGSFASEAGVAPEILWAIMRQESAFSDVAVSRSGAMGLMQVMPTTWDWIAELRHEEPQEPFDVTANIAYGATYLAWLLNYFDGDEELAIAGYNGGQGYVRRLFESSWVAEDKDEFYREIDQPETREYLQIVFENLLVYRALYGDAGASATEDL